MGDLIGQLFSFHEAVPSFSQSFVPIVVAFIGLLIPALKVYFDWWKYRHEDAAKSQTVKLMNEHEQLVAEMQNDYKKRLLTLEAAAKKDVDIARESLVQANMLTLQSVKLAAEKELLNYRQSNEVELQKYQERFDSSLRSMKYAWRDFYKAYKHTRSLYQNIQKRHEEAPNKRVDDETLKKWEEKRDYLENLISRSRMTVRGEQPFFLDFNLGETMMESLKVCADLVRDYDYWRISYDNDNNQTNLDDLLRILSNPPKIKTAGNDEPSNANDFIINSRKIVAEAINDKVMLVVTPSKGNTVENRGEKAEVS